MGVSCKHFALLYNVENVTGIALCKGEELSIKFNVIIM